MKNLILPGLILLAAASVRAQEPRIFSAADEDRPIFGFDIRLGGVAFEKDCWDDDVGGAFDLGFQVWEPSGIFGLWAGIGAQSASYVWEDDWGEVESDVIAVPFGASLLARLPLGDVVALRAEIGARYVMMDIDDWNDDDYYERHHRRWREPERDRYWNPDRYLDVDDTSLAVVSLQFEFDFDPVVLAVGGGYQFDLERPDVEYLHRPIGKVDLSGALFYVDVGLVF